ncbi:MAG: orotate phosphoribosyltransferase [Elusimicrobia bacterium]|nr:orotate phosphoribosyltransferase [Elusimicrobiota bacterium]
MNPTAEPLTPEELERRGALLRGHFLLSSGLHSDRYVQCAQLFKDARFAEELGRRLAARAPAKADLVASPAMGGLFIGHETAKALGLPHIFTERVEGAMTLRRGFRVEEGQRFLVVEDVLTTGKSTREVIEALVEEGGIPVGALSVIDRGVDPATLGVPVASLLALELKACRPEDCALCRGGVPAVKPGSRAQPTLKRE